MKNTTSSLRRVQLPRTPADWLEAVMNFIFFLCGMLAVGCVVAFVVSLAAIRFLMDYVKRHNFTFFGIYRIALGLVVLAVAVVSAMV